MSPFTILGIKSNADLETAKLAYRRASAKFHPDHGGDEEKFKEAKAAWEAIEAGYRDPASGHPAFTGRPRPRQQWEPPRAPPGAWHEKDINSIFEELKAANRNAPNGANHTSSTDELIANVTMREAFAGYTMIVPRRHHNGAITNSTVQVPPGMPHGYRQRYQTSDGVLVTIITRIITGDFHLRGLDDQDNLFSAGLSIGDVELEHEIHALDIVLGGWIQVKDFLGEALTVRVPAGFNPLHRLKISNKGYYGWDPLTGTPSARRQDMYLRLMPLYTRLEDLAPEKINGLYKAVQVLKDEG